MGIIRWFEWYTGHLIWIEFQEGLTHLANPDHTFGDLTLNYGYTSLNYCHTFESAGWHRYCPSLVLYHAIAYDCRFCEHCKLLRPRLYRKMTQHLGGYIFAFKLTINIFICLYRHKAFQWCLTCVANSVLNFSFQYSKHS